MKPPKSVAITGAAGQVAYSLVFQIARGDLFGPDQPVAFHLIDLPETQKCLEGVAMELQDCAFPLVQKITTGSNAEEMFNGIHFVFLLGSKPRGPGMERRDLLLDNGKIFLEQGRAIQRSASPDVLVLVVGNPCNTNCLIALKNAPDLNPRRFFAMTFLDQNRAVYQLAAQAKTGVGEVANVTIWGNHSTTQVPDFLNAKIRERPALQAIKDRRWLENDFFVKVRQRGADVISCRGKSSAASAAKAACDAMQSVVKPTAAGRWFSMGVYSRGNPYGIDENLVFSFPCRSKGMGDIEIVPDLAIDPFLKEKLSVSQQELMDERNMVAHLLKG